MEDERLTPEEYLLRLESEISSGSKKEEAPREDKTEKEKPAKAVKKKKKKRKKKHYFLRFLFFVAIIFGLFYALQSELFYVTDIEVTGNQFYTPAQVIEMSGIETGKNMFFEVKTRPARDALLSTPYIKLVNISRKPMGTIKIDIEERVEYAAIPDLDKYILIDDEGTVLSISDKQPALPILEGMLILTSEPGSPLKVEQAYLLTDTLDLLKATEQTDLYFTKIYFSSVLVKAYINDEYYCEGDPADIKDNLEDIRTTIQDHRKNGIDKGVLRVGSNSYIAFDPKIN